MSNHPACRLRGAIPCCFLIVALFLVKAEAQDSSSSANAASASARIDSAVPVTILEDTPLRVMTNSAITTRNAEEGAPLTFTLNEDVVVNQALAIPRGATLHGEVIKAKKSGTLTGAPELILKLDALLLGGRMYPLYSYQFKVTGESKTKPTEAKALRGAEIGAIVGAATVAEKGGVSDSARVANMTAGAAVGAGVGTLVSAASAGPGIRLPAESELEFQLASPITVAPVDAKEAARLAQGLHSGGPVLYVRGETP